MKSLRLPPHLISSILRDMIVPLPKSQTRHPARAQAPLHLPHMLF